MSLFEKKLDCFEEADYSKLFKIISENFPIGVVVTDNNSVIKFINAYIENITGILKEDIINKSFRSVFNKYLMENKDKNEILIINEKYYNLEKCKAKKCSGDEYNIFTLIDISIEINLHNELEKANHSIKELKDILEGSFDGFLVTDGHGNVLFVNKSYERVTSISREELIGKNMKDLINPIWMKNSVAFPVIEGKRPVSLHHTTRNNKNIIVTGTPVFSKDGEVDKIVINARDITEIYELREELQKAREMEKYYFENLNDFKNTLSSNTDIVVASDVMKEIFSLARKVSTFDTTVLILGESGVGKDVVAKYIHDNSLRKDKPFIVINCGAIPEHLLESELFGYEKGAFTGASKEGKMGLFEAAEGGVLFLDEIGEMAPNLQVKLLRVLESRQINRVGSIKPISVDVRVIAATNKDLESRVQTGEFREDLFYRLNVIQIKIPQLRERIQDIAPLSLYFLNLFNKKYGQNKRLTYDVIKEFENYNWTGNIRQLKNTIENMVVISNNEFLQINDLPWSSKREDINKSDHKIKDMDIDIIPLNEAIEITEKRLLTKALEKYKTTRKVAQAIKIDQSTVVRKMKKYGIS